MSVRPISAGLALLATAATVTFASAPANAAEMFSPRSMTVRYGDLDLASTDGQNRLNGRIGRAVSYVCGTGSRELPLDRGIQACRVDAHADARAQIATVIASNGAGGGAIQVARR